MRLLEVLTAPVHINKRGTLVVLPSFVEKDFRLDMVEYACLYKQVVYTISGLTNVPRQIIADALNVPAKGFYGHKLAEIIDNVNRTPVDHDGVRYRFRVGVQTYSTVQQAIDAVQSGQPVIAFTNIHDALSYHLSDLDRDAAGGWSTRKQRQGIVDFKDSRRIHNQPATRAGHHVLLLIGYDRRTKHLIFRETGATYAFKGYAKVSREILETHPHFVRLFLAIVVQDLKKKPINTSHKGKTDEIPPTTRR